MSPSVRFFCCMYVFETKAKVYNKQHISFLFQSVTSQLPGAHGYGGGKVVFIDTENTLYPLTALPALELSDLLGVLFAVGLVYNLLAMVLGY